MHAIISNGEIKNNLMENQNRRDFEDQIDQ